MTDKLRIIYPILRSLIIITIGVLVIVFFYSGSMQLLGIIFLILIILSVVTSIVALILNDTTEKNKKDDEYREYLLKELTKDTSKESNSEIKNVKITTPKKLADGFSTSVSFGGGKAVNKVESQLQIIDKELQPIVTNIPDIKTENKKDIIALMLKNNDEINGYFTISKNQAKSSYVFSIIASIIGIIMVGMAIYGTIVLNDSQLTIVGLVSGAITELLSGTVFWIHNKSALQLNHYYDALHQNEKFLSAISVADKLSDENREEMYMEIIRKQIDIED